MSCPVKESGKMSKTDMMKTFMSIDRELIREAQRTDNSPTNLSELDQVVTEIMRGYIPESEISAIAIGSKVLILPGEVTKEVSVKTGKVLQMAARAAENISIEPDKDKVETILKNLRGPAAKLFIYAFIPADSDVLKSNPTVREKRKIQIEAIATISGAISFPEDYLKKHIRNAIVDYYRTNPEQVLHDIANGKDKELRGLGSPDWAAIANSVSSVVSTASTFFKKQNAPAQTDYQKYQQASQGPVSQPQIVVIPPQQNVTRDPAYEKQNDNTLMYGILALLGVSVVGGGAYILTK